MFYGLTNFKCQGKAAPSCFSRFGFFVMLKFFFFQFNIMPVFQGGRPLSLKLELVKKKISFVK